MALPCPIENPARLSLFGWKEVKARELLSQPFKGRNGIDNPYYNQFTYQSGGKTYVLRGHDGLDFAIPAGTPLFAPMEGIVKVKNDYLKGYGLHVKIRCHDKEIILAHLSRVTVKSGEWVRQFGLIGYSGGALDHPYRGNSTGPHLHLGLRRIFTNPSVVDIFQQLVVDYENGYFGYIDPYPEMVWWKGKGDLLQIS